MRGSARFLAAAALVAAAAALASCNLDPGERRPRMTLFVGVDASGSFYNTGDYDDALIFLSHDLYGHLNGLGGLRRPMPVTFWTMTIGLGALVGVLDEGEHAMGDGVAGRLVPGHGEEQEEQVELVGGERLSVHLGGDERGDDVVPRVRLPRRSRRNA